MISGPCLLAHSRPQTFNVNVLGPLELTRALLPLLRICRGRIVFVSSLASVMGGPGQLPYAPSKAALDSASDVLRRELRGEDVQVRLASRLQLLQYVHS